MNKQISQLITPNEILKDYSECLKMKISELEDDFSLDREDLEPLIKEYPSKTSQNSMNFITQNSELLLRNNSQDPEVIKLFQIIVILLQQEKLIDINDESAIVEEVFKKLLPKFDCINLSKHIEI
jgi:hypothetical protein